GNLYCDSQLNYHEKRLFQDLLLAGHISRYILPRDASPRALAKSAGQPEPESRPTHLAARKLGCVPHHAEPMCRTSVKLCTAARPPGCCLTPLDARHVAGGWIIVSTLAPFSGGGFFRSLQRFLVWRFVVAKMGRPALPREVRVAFWDGVRAGLGV